MASSLDLSQDGPAMNRAVNNIISGPAPSGKSPTYAAWVLLYVQASLRNAFSQGPAKPSVLKVQDAGEGELEELFENFNDGRVQFALVKVKDPNTGLGKIIFFAWLGDGVPEHVKGNYPSYKSAVARLFEGYHVEINARDASSLNVDDIFRKVATASGSNYSNSRVSESFSKPAPPVAAKPAWKPGQAYTPTRQYGTPAAPRGRPSAPAPVVGKLDADGWGEDAPQVSRTKLETVGSAYKPTKVNIEELRKQPSSTTSGGWEKPDVVRGAYQPVGKVDIAAIRAQGDKKFDSRPEVVKGAYEPIGKVDIAAIRAAAQPPREEASRPVPRPAAAGGAEDEGESRSLADRAAAFNKPAPASGRITSLPKPTVTKKFGTPAAFGTKPNLPSEYGIGKNIQSTAPIGAANKDFASAGGKTPAQLWQEKKNRERGLSGASEPYSTPAPAAPVSSASPNFSPQPTGREEEDDESQSGGFSALRDRFKGVSIQTPGAPPPPMGTRPPPAPQQHEEEEEEERAPPPRFVPPPPAAAPQRTPSPSPPGSPARIAMPVARGSVPPAPVAERPRTPSPERPSAVPAAAAVGAGALAVGAGVGAAAAASSGGAVKLTGRRARIIYDYEAAEGNEIDLIEGQVVGMIELVDDDWWQGTNEKGENGLFPSNYVEPIEDDEDLEEEQQQPDEEYAPPAPAPSFSASAVSAPPPPPVPAAAAESAGPSAKAIYDYDAAEENELTFPDGALITDIEFPDDDWWHGSYNGKQGLFPSNYVELIE